ncbi:hypothetical protein CU098_007819 [Rhizopus stolonifer]|uniref:Uncharacterized protein n=1 Tax=Rhizopus stolonifer TaxID=4846 RepID=A0A367JW07_RHIST|nr:hypothetical protein CU098_007819 [Rhizopus stolonifer]
MNATIQPQQRTDAANFIEDFSSTLCTAIYGALDSSCGRKEHWNNYMHDFLDKGNADSIRSTNRQKQQCDDSSNNGDVLFGGNIAKN